MLAVMAAKRDESAAVTPAVRRAQTREFVTVVPPEFGTTR
jgi:hypothetical protein